jgi:streptogramin lyase/cytochrome c5
MALTLCVLMAPANAATISGKVVDASGKAMEGVMLTAGDEERAQYISVFTGPDGSFTIDTLRDTTYNVRARLWGQIDRYQNSVAAGATGLSFAMEPATGEMLEMQRTADSAFGMLKWDSLADKENFKQMCTYCHQAGTVGFRSPEEPVDWETMITRMDGFGGLYKHTQEGLVDRLLATFSDEAVAKWPPYVPPPAPTGDAAQVRITEWDMGELENACVHDLELGLDGLVYVVDMDTNCMRTLNPETGEREEFITPGQGWAGAHSIERGNDGNMWMTLCGSGQMAKFDVKTDEWHIESSAEAGKSRGSYPHTLRINPADPEGLVWYTDAGANAVFSMHPDTMVATKYQLLSADQAVGAGRGESSGITPYGLDFSPVDDSIWYSKLNGNRIGRIDPKVEGGDIKEWIPPFDGPRRIHVAPNGVVWAPGFGTGVIGAFDPKTEKWELVELDNSSNRIPYALNIDPEGNVWICGTGNDTLSRYNPTTKEMTVFRMPSRVTYTREIEFGDDGSIWTCNSNSPARHIERGRGSIIKLELLGD